MYCCEKKMKTIKTITGKDEVIRERKCITCGKIICTHETQNLKKYINFIQN